MNELLKRYGQARLDAIAKPFEPDSTYEVMDQYGYVTYFYGQSRRQSDQFIANNPGSRYIKQVITLFSYEY